MLILGGGSPKNFMLQTGPQNSGSGRSQKAAHDYFLQITDARPDTGGLSGATPQEAMTWGKVDPQQLPDTITCYLDSTVALPLITAYALANRKPRELRRLMDRMPEIVQDLEKRTPDNARARRAIAKTVSRPGLSSFPGFGLYSPRLEPNRFQGRNMP